MAIRVFLSHQVNSLCSLYSVSIITNMRGKENFLDNISDEVKIIDLPIKRNINLIYDFYVLFLLILFLRKNKFSLVHSISPKAGLLCAISAFIVRVPNRVHTFTGQVWVTKKGVRRWFLKLLNKLIIKLNTLTLIDSLSQKEFLVNENLISEENGLVLGRGSLSGVDLQRFKPSIIERDSLRKKLNISSDDVVFLFVGRVKKDKGIFELVRAFKNISKKYTNTVLLIVGPDEDNLSSELTDILDLSIKHTRFIDFTKSPEVYMMASDIFVIPSYREGFGSVVIESASCGIPSIGSNIYGLSDAIKDGKTGILVPVRSEISLEEAMIKLLNDDDLRLKMGNMARYNAQENFSQDMLTLLLMDLYKSIMK